MLWLTETDLKNFFGEVMAPLLPVSNLKKEQIDKLFMPDSPAMNKLKELSVLRMDKNLDGFTDDELVKELERRGFEVSIYTEKKSDALSSEKRHRSIPHG
jgi:hypothetical protein